MTPKEIIADIIWHYKKTLDPKGCKKLYGPVLTQWAKETITENLLKKINKKIDSLHDDDTASHIYWNQFRELVAGKQKEYIVIGPTAYDEFLNELL